MRNPYAPDQKQCRKCGEVKVIVEFRQSTAVCKACDLKRQSAWVARNREKSRALKSAYNHRHPEKLSSYQRSRLKLYPETRRAHKAVSRALIAGTLQKSPCSQCGIANSEAHHADYSKPLEVIWLCPSCHKRLHFKEALTTEQRNGVRKKRPGPARRGNVLDPDFIAWMYLTQLCLVWKTDGACSGQETVHHVREWGSPKNDRRTLKLCQGHHLHACGMDSIERLGKAGFEKRHGVNIEAAIEEYNREYENRQQK